jgi:protein-S-isoprenylcysteine O-methyltransferase Ste14
MEKTRQLNKKASKVLAWSTYVLILFEMLYMSTPFAVFFYSVYRFPLQLLNQNDASAWLVQNVLPHFAKTGSGLINTLLYVSWPLMGLGLLIFLVGFIQIYGSKLMKKGAVQGGLYRLIRHPQYTGLAIFGLGMSMFWSRMIVILMYVTMLFVYYFLARTEEKECLEKYGDNYQIYFEQTGRFLPKFGSNKQRTKNDFWPENATKRVLAFFVLYFLLIASVSGLGLLLRTYTLSQISTISEKNIAAISLYPMAAPRMTEIVSIARNDIKVTKALKPYSGTDAKKLIIYIIPSQWHVPELAMETKINAERREHGFNPTSHGNPENFNRNLYKVLISKAIVDPRAQGKEILFKAKAQKPILIVNVDAGIKKVTGIDIPPEEGKYADIPVPLF